MLGQSQILVKDICHLLNKREQSFSIAESCTCGMLSASFADVSGVSQIYQGGVVSYSNFSKEKLLGVKKESLKNYGAVSKEVALEMAKGIRENLKSDWAMSVTGIAGPSGGTKEKPVGTVFFSVVGPEIECWHKQSFSGNRESIQKQSIDFLLRTFRQNLKTKGE